MNALQNLQNTLDQMNGTTSFKLKCKERVQIETESKYIVISGVCLMFLILTMYAPLSFLGTDLGRYVIDVISNDRVVIIMWSVGVLILLANFMYDRNEASANDKAAAAGMIIDIGDKNLAQQFLNTLMPSSSCVYTIHDHRKLTCFHEFFTEKHNNASLLNNAKQRLDEFIHK